MLPPHPTNLSPQDANILLNFVTNGVSLDIIAKSHYAMTEERLAYYNEAKRIHDAEVTRCGTCKFEFFDEPEEERIMPRRMNQIQMAVMHEIPWQEMELDPPLNPQEIEFFESTKATYDEMVAKYGSCEFQPVELDWDEIPDIYHD